MWLCLSTPITKASHKVVGILFCRTKKYPLIPRFYRAFIQSCLFYNVIFNPYILIFSSISFEIEITPLAFSKIPTLLSLDKIKVSSLYAIRERFPLSSYISYYEYLLPSFVISFLPLILNTGLNVLSFKIYTTPNL